MVKLKKKSPTKVGALITDQLLKTFYITVSLRHELLNYKFVLKSISKQEFSNMALGRLMVCFQSLRMFEILSINREFIINIML